MAVARAVSRAAFSPSFYFQQFMSTVIQTIPNVSVQAKFPGTNLAEFDVMASHLPDNFLGMAFDLVVPGDWRFDRAGLCGDFLHHDSEVLQLASALPQDHRVVFGLAMTGNRAKVADGCVAAFYFHFEGSGGTGRVGFERQVMSVFDPGVQNGGRRDLGDVQWMGADFAFPGVGQTQAVAGRGAAGQNAGAKGQQNVRQAAGVGAAAGARADAWARAGQQLLAQARAGAQAGARTQQGGTQELPEDWPQPQSFSATQQSLTGQESLFDDLIGAISPSLGQVYLVILLALGLTLAFFAALWCYYRLRGKP